MDGVVFVAAGDGGLAIVNGADVLETPDSPTSYVLHGASGWVDKVAVVDGMAYLATRTGLEVVDVRNPQSPRTSGRFRTDAIADVVAHDGAVYAAGKKGVFRIPTALAALSANYTMETAGASIGYEVKRKEFVSGENVRLYCKATGGTCTVTPFNSGEHAATVNWVLPANPGDYELAVVVGNYHYYSILRDRVSVR